MLISFQGFQLIYANTTAMVHMWWNRNSDCYYSWWWDCQIEKIQRGGGGGLWWLSLGYLGHGGSWLGGSCVSCERERERERERDELNIGISLA